MSVRRLQTRRAPAKCICPDVFPRPSGPRFAAAGGDLACDGVSGGQNGRNSHYSDGIVVEDGRHVFRGEFVRGVADEETGLADRTVPDHDASVGHNDCLARST